MFKMSSLKGKLLFPIIFSTVLIILVLSLILVQTQKNVLTTSGTQMADLVTKQSSEMRKIYAGKIMPKIFENGGFDDANWENLKGAVPAAATFVNMVGHNLSDAIPGVKLRLYSEFPFTNRTLQLDEFEKRSLENLKKDRTKPYYEIAERNGETVIQYAIADVMAEGCVKCHNSHPLTSKNDWQVGDFRGAVSATIPLSTLEDEISNSFTVLNLIIVFLLLALIVYSFFGISKVTKNIKLFQKSLIDFFRYINREKNELDLSNINTNDEIGEMETLVNQNIIITKENSVNDMKVLGEIALLIDKVESGHYSCRIKSDTNNPMVKTLRNSINKMLDTISVNLADLREVLQGYANDDYRSSVTVPDKIQGRMRDIMEASNKLGASLEKNAKSNLDNGQSLNTNASLLKSSMEELASKTSQQAASLEETATSLSEITALTKKTSNNAQKMGEFGENIKSSVTDGQELATKTASSMEEINEKVSSINEAITVIDQIAFQTNILSLNAAVEAATAGEAGKGFAVVAQEVRNLATRSAEAAKEIKDLVEAANIKTNAGKSISNEMIEGYQELNDQITQNISLIEDVTTASKEQMSGIGQINDAVASLDTMTQHNAEQANQLSSVAGEVSQMATSLVEDAKTKKFKV